VALVSGQTYNAVSWSVQFGRGCAGAKTIGVFYFPTGVCYNNGSSSYQYSCDATGIPSNTSFADARCTTGAVPVVLPQNCQNNNSYGYFYGCFAGSQNPPAGEMRVNDYSGANCASPITVFVQAAQGQCVGSFGESFTVNCDPSSNEVSYVHYPGAVDCTGASSVINETSGVCSGATEIFCPGQGNSAAVLSIPLTAAALALLALFV